MKFDIRRLKPWMLPIAMLIGALFHDSIGHLQFLSKYLIFLMLVITYCKVSLKGFRIDRYMIWLLAVQILGSVAVYLALLPFDRVVAEAVAICVVCPTATAAPVITSMLGGSIERVASYSLLSNFSVALIAPVMFAVVGEDGVASPSFGESVVMIGSNVMPLLLGPLVVAAGLWLTVPGARSVIATHQSLSFYIWAFSLIIVVGNAVSFIMAEPSSCIPQLVVIAFLSLAVCLAQFYIGRRIGRKAGDQVSAAQSLGQKNTVLAVWMALTYLNPLASAGPACYIAWHNIVNSMQIYRHNSNRAN